jgi:hypothetical protein
MLNRISIFPFNLRLQHQWQGPPNTHVSGTCMCELLGQAATRSANVSIPLEVLFHEYPDLHGS